MWFKKENKITTTKDKVLCETCKHEFPEEYAQVVKIHQRYDYNDYKTYYCPMHKVPYDREGYRWLTCEEARCQAPKGIQGDCDSSHDRKCYEKYIPETYEEVTKEGKPVKK